ALILTQRPQWTPDQVTTRILGTAGPVNCPHPTLCGAGLVDASSAIIQDMALSPLTVSAAFTASITLKNTGSSTWSSTHGFELGSQSPVDNSHWGTNRVVLAPGESIATGQEKTFLLSGSAPDQPGTHDFQWQM